VRRILREKFEKSLSLRETLAVLTHDKRRDVRRQMSSDGPWNGNHNADRQGKRERERESSEGEESGTHSVAASRLLLPALL